MDDIKNGTIDRNNTKTIDLLNLDNLEELDIDGKIDNKPDDLTDLQLDNHAILKSDDKFDAKKKGLNKKDQKL